MELPFTSQFIKKIEAYQTLKRLNKKFKRQTDLEKESTLATWEIEKKILKWTYWGHRHLASAIYVKEMDKRMNHMDISYLELHFGGVRNIFGNLVMKGYATFYVKNKNETEEIGQHNCDGIHITQEGLLMGELIDDLYRLDIINQCSNNRAIKYKRDVGAERFLFYKFWPKFLYESLVWLSYGALILAAIFILKEFWSLGVAIFNKIFS